MGWIDGNYLGQGSPPPWSAVSELAAEQWGVVSRAQLRAAGVAAANVDYWVQAGRLHVVHRGVYAVGHRSLRREGRFLAAVLACGPGAVLSHRSAAWHWVLLASDQAVVDVIGPRSRQGGPGIRLHRVRLLDARDTTTHEGIAVTTVARTLLDLAATVRADRLERACAQALHLGLYDQRAISDVIERANGHRGRSALMRATAREPKLTKSDWEARMLTLIRDNGLPEPLVNHALIAPDHGHVVVDFYWPAHRLIVETDSWSAHGTKAAYETDRARDAALQAAGYRVVRFTWHTPDATTVKRLRALIAGTRPQNG
ncbi:MAG TPA: type IV toxin-antitoxin system AbiEi family antitoxin domain-containing protein [Solirubrobacteraceae bacterium]